MTTTAYGTWVNHGDPWNESVEATVDSVLDGGTREWRERLVTTGARDRIIDDYRRAIDDALPPSVTLSGNDFYGPSHPDDNEWEGYPVKEYGPDVAPVLDMAAIIEAVSLEDIIERHDPDII